jgi:hypothetical protein
MWTVKLRNARGEQGIRIYIFQSPKFGFNIENVKISP